MKQVIALNPWLQALHKIVVTSGYVALVAVVAGANVKVKNTDLTLTDALPPFRNKAPQTLLIQQCLANNQTEKVNLLENKKSCKHEEELNKKIFNSTLDKSLGEHNFSVEKHINHKEV